MKKNILIFLLLLISISIHSTGASYIHCIIKPVSINKDDYILCKTKLEKNEMGALRIMPVEYGWIIINPNGEQKYFKEFYFDSDSYGSEDLKIEHYKYLENNFDKDVDWKYPPVFILPLINKYNFKENNAKKYFINTEISLNTFFSKYNIDQKNYIQKTLEGHISKENSDMINIVFKYKNIIILRNYNTLQNPKIIGSNFDFYVNISNNLYYYEIFDVYGILQIFKAK